MRVFSFKVEHIQMQSLMNKTKSRILSVELIM